MKPLNVKSLGELDLSTNKINCNLEGVLDIVFPILTKKHKSFNEADGAVYQELTNFSMKESQANASRCATR